jgi:hypothetical protein
MGTVAPYAVSFFLRLIYGVTNILTKIAFSQVHVVLFFTGF